MCTLGAIESVRSDGGVLCVQRRIGRGIGVLGSLPGLAGDNSVVGVENAGTRGGKHHVAGARRMISINRSDYGQISLTDGTYPYSLGMMISAMDDIFGCCPL